MLGKLIKYEFRASGQLIPLAFLVVLLLAAAGLALSFTAHYIYTLISFIMLLLAGAAAMIITYVVVFLRFHRGMFGAEGYLAMTLPATPAQLYLSKTIVAFVWLLLSGVMTILAWIAAMVAFVSSMVRVVAADEGVAVENMWRQFWRAWNELPANEMQMLRSMFSPGFITIVVVMSIIGYLAFAAQVFFCVTIANVKPFQKMGIAAAVLAFVVLYIVNGTLSTALTYFLPMSVVFDPVTGWALSARTMWSSMFGGSFYTEFSMGIGAYVLNILYAFALPVLTVRLIERKVNLK